MNHFYRTSNANVHRGLHVLAERATEVYECARTRLAFFINAARPAEIVWTRGATEAINLVAHGWGRKFLRPGDEVLVSRMEHHANLVPWQLLAKERGVTLRVVELDPDGALRLEDLDRRLAAGRVRLAAFTHVSNVLGVVNPVQELARRVHAAGALLLVDGCQAAPHMPVDVQALGADFYVFSAHKMLGPTGLGALYGRQEILERMDPFMGGGEMIQEVTLESSTFKGPPLRFEAGTPPIAETAGLTAAVDYLGKVGMSAVRAHEKSLIVYGLERLAQVPGLRVFGPVNPEVRSGIFAFDLKGIHPHDVAQFLDAEGIAVRAGHHCAQPLHHWLGLPATARASVHLYTTESDLDALVKALLAVRKKFGSGA
jgi:cysteine desulfurase/selenocysteine lyase